jgi:DNA-binding Lrp family transcriptional regulator
MVGLNAHLSKDARSFEAAMAQADEVRECHNITGSVEYLLRVEVADLEAYKTFHADTLGVLPQVASITSHISLGSSKDLRG